MTHEPGRASEREAERADLEIDERYPSDPGRTIIPEPEPQEEAFAEPEHWVGGQHRARTT